MSQYNSRIYIKVKDVEDWKKLSDIDFQKYGFCSNPFDGYDQAVFEIDGDWACFEDELESLVYKIHRRISNCVIFADTNNINVDPYNFIVYKIGDEVDCKDIDGDMQWETQIDDPFGWFAAARIRLKKAQTDVLKEFGFKKK